MADRDGRLDLWFRRYRPNPDSGMQLVCLPHAGGSASFFLPLTRLLTPSVEVIGVQYPGRQDRRDEPLIDDLGRLADQIAALLPDCVDRPYALFGHSMGATLGFEVARRLAGSGGPQPIGLIASGRRAPVVHRVEDVHTRDDAGLLAELRRLSGTELELLDDPEFLQMILPPMRSDYRAIERYQYVAGAPVSFPITVLVGESDPRVSLTEARAWAQCTAGDFHFRSFQGGHFYLNAQQQEVARVVLETLRAFNAPVPAEAAAVTDRTGPQDL